MIRGKKLIVVLPAYNAGRTLERTYRDLDRCFVDEVLLVDDASQDCTTETAKRLGILCHQHRTNLGYGANQKTCYQIAVSRGADVVVMLHPDYQYPPELVVPLADPIADGQYHVMLGSRMLAGNVLQLGMPLYKYLCNRLWTWGQNSCFGRHFSEYHTGFRAFSRTFLLQVPLLENSDDFLFDNQVIAQALYFGYAIGEVAVPARFDEDSSSINPWRGSWYGVGVVATTIQYVLQQHRVARFRIFSPTGRRLTNVNAAGCSTVGPLGAESCFQRI